MRRKILLIMSSVVVVLILIAAPAQACESGSWITSDPGSGDSGTVVTVEGGGFEAGSVTLRWDASAESGGAVLGQAPVGPDGSIRTEVTIPEASPGEHKIVAEHDQAGGQVTHPESWEYFTIPGAPPAPADERPNEQQRPQRAERPEKPSGTEEEPGSGKHVTSRTGIQTQTVAEPAVVTPVETGIIANEHRHETKVARPLGPVVEKTVPTTPFDRPLREPDMVAVPVTEAAPAAREPGGSDRSLPWWLAAAVATLLLPLIARRMRSSRPDEADVLAMPVPGPRQEERDVA
ncbi:MAG: hypothetical protein M3N53_14290 [Actinomycetota bacterium]|nr:hypothetical protein [Actinomycetota bacterium]